MRLDTTSDKTTIKAALPEGVALKLTEPTAGGKTESYTDKVDVKVSAPGAFDLSLKVEAGTEPRNVEVTATADVPAMPVGSVWSQATSGQITNPFAAGGRGSSTELITNRFANYQLPSLVLAKSSTVPLSDTTNFSWTAPVATPPSTTTTTPPAADADPAALHYADADADADAATSAAQAAVVQAEKGQEACVDQPHLPSGPLHGQDLGPGPGAGCLGR